MIRFFDVVFSAMALILLSPALVLVAVVLRFTGEHAIFFSQKRVGRNMRRFQLLKFATMLKDSPNIGPGVVTLKDDPRVLPVGRFLRKTKINELPQLLNVLRGDMSLIGPRPQAEGVFEMFPPERREQMTSVPPGLSGIGSILFRDEESIVEASGGGRRFYEEVLTPYKAEVECWFADNRSLANYFLLIFLTVWVIANPSSCLVWRLFPSLPRPQGPLRQAFDCFEARFQ